MRSFFPRNNLRLTFGPNAAFSLLEILITFLLVIVIMVVALEGVTNIEKSWKRASVDSFAEAEEAFSVLTQNLAGATLEPYQDYADSSGTFRTNATTAFVPDHLARRSDLAFVCGPTSGTNGLLTTKTTSGCGVFFLSPHGYTTTEPHAGMEHLLNAMGYFVEFGKDDAGLSFLSTASRWRWRLKEIRQPSESLEVFALSSSTAWVQQLVSSQSTTPVLAENVIALIILPERAANDPGATLSADFRYDSHDASNPLTRHQLPSRVRVALMAIDEASAQTLAVKNGSNPPALIAGTLFQKAAQLDADLASLDQTLTAQKIGHRLFQREILLPSAAWSNTLSQ